MLSFAFRRVLSHPGSFSIIQILPKHGILSNQSSVMIVQRNLATTAGDRNSDSTANSKSESESKPKSTRRKTGSSTEAAGKKEKEAGKQPKIVIRPEDKPPKIPANAFILWLADYLRSRPKFGSLKEAQSTIKEGSQVYNALSENDRQQYREKAEVLRAEYNRRLDEWREKVDPVILNELNRRRVAKGKKRIPRSRGARRPMSGYLRHLLHVRSENPRGEEDHATHFRAISVRASNEWRAMSDAEKAEYNDAAKADFDAWREKRTAESQASQDKA